MFASGELVPDEVVDTVVRECDRRKIEFVWEPGDVLMIDNSVTMHARNPFEGASRRILASMRGRPVLAPFHADAQKRVVLPSWDAMPTTAFGCWKLRDPEQAVYNAIRTGYRHIDAASDYGNEEAIGRGIRRAIDEKLAVREDLFVTSKLWGTDHREARGACKRSLRNMGLDCFDMYMIHFPIALDPRFTSNGWSRDDGGGMTTDRVPLHATWARMEGLVRDGLVRNVDEAAAVVPRKRHPRGSYGVDEGGLFSEPLLRSVAAKHGVEIPAVLLSWARARNTSVVVRSETPKHLWRNLHQRIELDADDLRRLALIDRCRRYNDPAEFLREEGGFEPIFD